MAWPVALGYLGSVIAALVVPPGHRWTGFDVLDWAGNVLFMMAAAASVVLASWNLAHPDTGAREALEERRAEMRERALESAGRSWRGSAAHRDPGCAVLRGGTVYVHSSVVAGSSLRYLGPPPLYTPPAGYRLLECGARTCGCCGQVITPVLARGNLYYWCPDCTSAPEALGNQAGQAAIEAVTP